MIDEDPTHLLGGESQELSPPPPCHLAAIHELQVHIVDERGRLERVIGRLSPHERLGEVPKLVVNGGEN